MTKNTPAVRRSRERKRILIVTQEIDPHADVMALRLQKRGIRAVRFHPQSMGRPDRLTLGFTPEGATSWQLTGDYGTLRDSEVGSVWYRRPMFALDRDLSDEEALFAQGEIREAVMGLFRLSKAFWVNRPDAVRVAESKPLQLGLAQKIGFRVPRTLITNDPQRFRDFYDECRGDVIFKTMTQGSLGASEGKGIYTSLVSRAHLKDLEAIRRAPCLFQEHIRKAMDLRVTVIGEKVFPVEIHSQDHAEARVDWRKGDAARMRHAPHKLPGDLEGRCLKLLGELSLVYGAIDLILTSEGEYIFLELNPSGQFAWIETMTKLPLIETLADLLVSHT